LSPRNADGWVCYVGGALFREEEDERPLLTAPYGNGGAQNCR